MIVYVCIYNALKYLRTSKYLKVLKSTLSTTSTLSTKYQCTWPHAWCVCVCVCVCMCICFCVRVVCVVVLMVALYMIHSFVQCSYSSQPSLRSLESIGAKLIG